MYSAYIPHDSRQNASRACAGAPSVDREKLIEARERSAPKTKCSNNRKPFVCEAPRIPEYVTQVSYTRDGGRRTTRMMADGFRTYWRGLSDEQRKLLHCQLSRPMHIGAPWVDTPLDCFEGCPGRKATPPREPMVWNRPTYASEEERREKEECKILDAICDFARNKMGCAIVFHDDNTITIYRRDTLRVVYEGASPDSAWAELDADDIFGEVQETLDKVRERPEPANPFFDLEAL